MAANDFLDRLGFAGDPFESTNADQEPNLDSYFVPPPYFPTVVGDPDSPQSHVVLAPRGGGKTAQRRMVEQKSAADGDFLCITYDRFDQLDDFKVSQASWAYHVNQLCRLMLFGLLVKFEDDPDLAYLLSDRQKQVLKFQVSRFLGSLSAEEVGAAVDSLKNFGDKAHDFWHKYGGPVAVLTAAILKKMGFDGVELPKDLAEESRRDDNLRFHFDQLLAIAQQVGFKSTYLLVDKVDELSLTSNSADASFEFIKSLLTDLPTLESSGVAFKFFLWDKYEDAYRAGGSRPDRIPIFTLKWSIAELEIMLTQRLRAYSHDQIDSLNQLTAAGSGINLHRLVCILATGSPRDMIRLGKRIFAEETRAGVSSSAISEDAVWQGIREFSSAKAQEIIPNYIGELTRVGKPTFTTNHVGSEVFRISDNAARRKLQLWGDSGAVQKIGEIPNRNRPSHLYGVVDLRVAVAMLPAVDVPLILGNYALVCPSCEDICITDRQEVDCPWCSSHFQVSAVNSLLQDCGG
jgi:hypothetical protein